MRRLPDAPPTVPYVKVSLIRFLRSDFSDTKQVLSRLAHIYAVLNALYRSCSDTVCGLEVPPVVPFGRTLCLASPSLQWVPWTSVPHLTDQIILPLTFGNMFR
jgi:hypothetical protein